MIYDCFTFFNEFKVLELRLAELYDVVDRFVLVEADRTFQGQPKPYHFEENKHRFHKYLDKIEHVKITIDDGHIAARASQIGENWAREEFQRNSIATGIVKARKSDLIIVSDVDEIIDARALETIVARRHPNEISVLEMPLFYFCVNRVSRDRNRRIPIFRWFGPRIISYEYFTTAERLRKVRAYASPRTHGTLLGPLHTIIRNAAAVGFTNRVRIYTDSGWHFTSMGDWENFRAKVDSYSHPENKEWPFYGDELEFRKFIAEGSDPYPVEQLPRYVRENNDHFHFA